MRTASQLKEEKVKANNEFIKGKYKNSSNKCAAYNASIQKTRLR